MFWDIAATLLVLAACGQIFYLSMLTGQRTTSGQEIVPDRFENVSQKTHLPVSIIICAKNEAENLRRNLPAVLSQENYKKGREKLFEVVVVDDCSTDDTQQVLYVLAQEHPHLRVVTILPDELRTAPGKKYALSRGVAAAAHDHLLLTDADCKPASNQWLRRMVSPLYAGKAIVAGYGAYRKQKGLLNCFIRSETVFAFLQMHGLALLGLPYMAVGRNMAVKKELLISAQRDRLWYQSPSGDDDLLVRLFATKENYYVCTHPESFTYSDAKEHLAAYIRQKQRHMSTGKFYKASVKFWLGLNGISHVLFWLLLPLVIAGQAIGHDYGRMGLALIAFGIIRAVWIFLHLWTWSKQLHEPGLPIFAPVFDLLVALYNIGLSPYILWKTKQRWK